MLHKTESNRSDPVCLFAVELKSVDGQTCFMHSHACTEIIWTRGGTGWMLQDGQRLRYGDGDIGLYQPGMEHGDVCERACTHLCVGVSGGGAELLRPGILHADHATIAILKRVHAELDRRDEWRQKRLNLLSGCLVLELQRQLMSAMELKPHMPQPVIEAKLILDTRYAQPLTMTAVAEECDIQPDYLRQLFIKWIGEPPMRYLIRKRLAAACDLLRLNQQTNAQVAARVGIPNPFYFSRLFHQRIGESPSRYRRRHTHPITPRRDQRRRTS
ncbi:MAG: helix-turn-helix transcriptional regulator [Phycisphaeraceae bacterium]|nr:helix-turn-helix transcriptional regulator [Phycisphaeraceae bacterium]